MPTYEYECTKCGYRFELFQSMKEEPLTECPECASFVKRLIGSGMGVIFRGPGFYATDYRAKEKISEANTCANADKNIPSCKNCRVKPDKK